MSVLISSRLAFCRGLFTSQLPMYVNPRDLIEYSTKFAQCLLDEPVADLEWA